MKQGEKNTALHIESGLRCVNMYQYLDMRGAALNIQNS